MSEGEEASESARRATSRKKSSSPTPLIMSVASVMGTLPWRMLSSRSLTGPARAGMERTMRAPRRNRMMSAMPMTAPRASSRGAWPEKQRRSPHFSHVPSQTAAVKNVAR